MTPRTEDLSPGLAELINTIDGTPHINLLLQELTRSREQLKKHENTLGKIRNQDIAQDARNTTTDALHNINTCLTAISQLKDSHSPRTQLQIIQEAYKTISPKHIEELINKHRVLIGRPLKRAGLISALLAAAGLGFALGQGTKPVEPEPQPKIEQQQTPPASPEIRFASNQPDVHATLLRLNIPYTGVIQQYHGKTVLQLIQIVAQERGASPEQMIAMIVSESHGRGSSFADYRKTHPDPAGYGDTFAISKTNVRGIGQITETMMRAYLALLGIDYDSVVGSKLRGDDYWQLQVLALMLEDHSFLYRYADGNKLVAAYYNGGTIVLTAIKNIRERQEQVNWERFAQELRNIHPDKQKAEEIIQHGNKFLMFKDALTLSPRQAE
jgi:hypothetical protein